MILFGFGLLDFVNVIVPAIVPAIEIGDTLGVAHRGEFDSDTIMSDKKPAGARLPLRVCQATVS